jgi:hypothetical protein
MASTAPDAVGISGEATALSRVALNVPIYVVAVGYAQNEELLAVWNSVYSVSLSGL